MKLSVVEELEMSSLSVCEAYAHVSYVVTILPLTEYTQEDETPPSAVGDPERPLLLSALRLPSNFKLASRRLRLRGDPAYNGAAVSAGMRLDIPAYLPPEISVHILRFLHPRHLCRYC